MVRWQNQEDPGYATPSSSDDELEEQKWKTPKKVPKINVSLPISDYQNDKWERSRSNNKSLEGRIKTKIKDESVWGFMEDGWGEFEERTKPATPGGGMGVWKNDLKKPRGRSQPQQGNNLKKKSDPSLHHSIEEAGINWFWYSPNIDSGHRSQEHCDSPLVEEKSRYSLWTNPESVWDEVESDAFSLPTPRHDSLQSNNKFESFLSLLPWGKYLLTPEKPKNRHTETLPESSFEYPSSTPALFNGHPGLPVSPKLNDGEDFSLWSNEPKICPTLTPIHQQDSVFEERLAMTYIEGQRISEFKNDTSSQKDFIVQDMDNWHYRVLFPPENLSDRGFTNNSSSPEDNNQ